MIYELVEAEVKPGSEEAFQTAYGEATKLLLRAKGCRSVRMMRGIERPNFFRILVQWETIEDHTQGFRGSPAHQQLIAQTRQHYANPALVQHYTLVSDSDA